MAFAIDRWLLLLLYDFFLLFCFCFCYFANSAPGVDGISPKFIKMTKVIVTPFLTKLYIKCIRQERFPYLFKVSQNVPVPKTASPKELSEFRSIFLINMFSKLFEKIMKDRMMKFIDKNSILNSNQFGFKTNSSTELAVTTIHDTFLDNLDKNLYTCAIFLDIKKTFDTIDHKILVVYCDLT